MRKARSVRVGARLAERTAVELGQCAGRYVLTALSWYTRCAGDTRLWRGSGIVEAHRTLLARKKAVGVGE